MIVAMVLLAPALDILLDVKLPGRARQRESGIPSRQVLGGLVNEYRRAAWPR
jgi:hypothetical protein